MSSTIEVLIQGMIMFVSASVYGTAATGTGAAIAIEASTTDRTGTLRRGQYGVTIPGHEAYLSIVKDAVADPGTTGRLKLTVDRQHYRVALAGDRIQIGTFVEDQCQPSTGDGASGDFVRLGIPDIAQFGLASSTALAKDARPHADVYSGISSQRVGGWLNMPGGKLELKEQLERDAEFRPSFPLYRYLPADVIQWSFDVSNPCMVITPFNTRLPVTIVRLRNNRIQMLYHNLPLEMSDHVHGRRGASYDFELLYDILADKPSIPPIPYLVPPELAANPLKGLKACIADCLDEDEVNVKTGINCGPGGNSKP